MHLDSSAHVPFQMTIKFWAKPMLARSLSFSPDILGYHLFIWDLYKVFKWYFPSKAMCSLYQLAMPIIWVHLFGIFHNVTTHVEDCYDSVLKFITLAKYAELSVHFKLAITWCSVLVDLNCLWITYIMLMMTVVILPGPWWLTRHNIWQSTSYD